MLAALTCEPTYRCEPSHSVSARLSGRLRPAVSLGGGVNHAAFDETAALINAGIATTSIDADADIALQPRVSLGGGGSWTRLSGGSGRNSRVAASGALRWSVTGALSLAAAMRGDPLPSTEVTLVEAWPDWFPRRDAELALEVDRFAFALPVHRENGLLIARAART